MSSIKLASTKKLENNEKKIHETHFTAIILGLNIILESQVPYF